VPSSKSQVSDSASTDGIPEIVREYQDAYLAVIQYSRNDYNLGYDRNVDMLFKKASGQFVWILGDDDTLEDGALTHVLNLIDQNPDIKVMQVNFDKFDKKLERIVEKVLINEDLYCYDAEAFLVNSKGRYGAVSSLIFNKEAWNREDLFRGFGSEVIHMYALVKILLRGDSYICKQSLVKVREGSENFVKRGDGDALLRIALASGSLYCFMREIGYGPKIIRWLLKPDRRYAYNAISPAKLWGIKNKLVVVKKLIAIHNSPVLWLKWIPTIFIPDPIFRKIYFLKKRISSKTRIIERKLKEYLKIGAQYRARLPRSYPPPPH
jgi:glycosyltransferase involved in cell wall biosynthesis